MQIRAAGNVARAAARLKILAAQSKQRAAARQLELEGDYEQGGLEAPLLQQGGAAEQQPGSSAANGRATTDSLSVLPEESELPPDASTPPVLGSPLPHFGSPLPHLHQQQPPPASTASQRRSLASQTSMTARSEVDADGKELTDHSFTSNPASATPSVIGSALSGGDLGFLQRRSLRHIDLCESIAAREERGDKHLPGWRRDMLAIKEMVFGSWLSVLLVCAPLGAASALLQWGAVPTFVLNFMALVPLALILGDITEDLAVRFGDTVGGLINATFGNTVEMILSVAALLKGLYSVVAMSLLGSILSNLLLVLGCCFFFGGLKFQIQTFNAAANNATSSLLFLSCIGIIIPTTATMLVEDGSRGENWILDVSRFTAVVLLCIYICYIIFQLVTHTELFQGDADEGEPVMTLTGAFLALTLITAAVAVSSEFLTGSIEEFSVHTGLSEAFVGMIILPIAGNACEHITAIVVAMKNKMDLSLGVAVGSSIQIATFVIPFVVLVGWATGHPFTLDFDPFSTVALTVAVIHANQVMSGAHSHWLMGVELMATYVLIAGAFLF